MIQPQMKFIVGVISLPVSFHCGHFARNEISSGDEMSCKHYPKWSLLNGPFFSERLQNKISFHLARSEK